jgi:hypothetical protein
MSFLPSIHELTPKHLQKNAKTSNEIKTPMPPLSLSRHFCLSLSKTQQFQSPSPATLCHHLRRFFYYTQPKKSILMSQNLFFDSKLKPRIGRLTLQDLIILTPENMTVGAREGEHEDPHRRPTPETHTHHLRPARSDPWLAAPWVFFSASLSLSPHCVCPSPSSISRWLARMCYSFFLLFFLLPFFVLHSSLRLNEKNLVFLVYTSFLQFFCFI